MHTWASISKPIENKLASYDVELDLPPNTAPTSKSHILENSTCTWQQPNTSTSRDFRIHQMYLCREVRKPWQTNVLDMPLKIWWWGYSTGALGDMERPFIALLPSSLWHGVLVPIKVSSMGKKNRWFIYYIWNHLTVCKQMINI